MTHDYDADDLVAGEATPAPPRWERLVGPCIRSAGVEACLGLTRREVAAMASQRLLLRVVSADGLELYPTWQFGCSGLPEILSLFPESEVDGWTLAGWLRTPEPELGESPLAALTRGGGAHLHAVAQRAAKLLSA